MKRTRYVSWVKRARYVSWVKRNDVNDFTTTRSSLRPCGKVKTERAANRKMACTATTKSRGLALRVRGNKPANRRPCDLPKIRISRSRSKPSTLNHQCDAPLRGADQTPDRAAKRTRHPFPEIAPTGTKRRPRLTGNAPQSRPSPPFTAVSKKKIDLTLN